MMKMKKHLAKKEFHKVVEEWKKLRRNSGSWVSSGSYVSMGWADRYEKDGRVLFTQAKTNLEFQKFAINVTQVKIKKDEKPQVKINGHWLREQAWIKDTNGKRIKVGIKKIHPTQVVLWYKGIEFTVKVKP